MIIEVIKSKWFFGQTFKILKISKNIWKMSKSTILKGKYIHIVFPKLNFYENYTRCLYFSFKKTSNSTVESTLGVVYFTCLQKKNHVAGWELFFFFVWIYEHTHFSFSQYIVYRTNENIDIIMYEGIDTSVSVSLYDFYIFFFALFMKFLFVYLFLFVF